MEYLLTFQSGPEAGRQVKLDLGVTYSIGRAPDVQIHLPADDHQASRYHATLTPMLDGVDLQDLRSRNGTYVEGVRINKALLHNGERFRIGRTELGVMALGLDDTVRMPPPEMLELQPPPKAELKIESLGFDSSDLDDLDAAAATAGSVVGPGSGSAPCEGCGKFGPAPAERFADAGRLCAECAAARRPKDSRLPDRIGPYRVIRHVGQGAMGAVYEARHEESEAHVALKTLLPESPLDRGSIGRFLREQRVAITLSHPRIVRSYDVGEDAHASLLYLATEWLPGGDAEPLCSPKLSLDVALSLGADVFEALAYLHGRGFIHRDVKPANLLLFHDGPSEMAGKLSDFGIVKNARETGSRLTMDHEMGGTPLYVAPEQLLDFKWVGRSADVYSGAASIYALLTGASPLPLEEMGGGKLQVVVYTAVLEEARVPLLARRADVPPALAEWIDAAVARDPAAREQMDTARIAAWLRGFTKSSQSDW